MGDIKRRCQNCKYWNANAINLEFWGTCDKWKSGYHISLGDLKTNDCLVEDDEEWGNFTGKDFGCVLFDITTPEPTE